MKDDYTTNSHYLTYIFLFRKVGRMYFFNLGVKGQKWDRIRRQANRRCLFFKWLCEPVNWARYWGRATCVVVFRSRHRFISVPGTFTASGVPSRLWRHCSSGLGWSGFNSTEGSLGRVVARGQHGACLKPIVFCSFWDNSRRYSGH